MASGANGAQRSHVEHLQQQIADHRRELAETVSTLHDKADVTGRAHEKAVGAELAVADFAQWAGRRLGTMPRLLTGLVRRPLRPILVLTAVVVAFMARRARQPARDRRV